MNWGSLSVVIIELTSNIDIQESTSFLATISAEVSLKGTATDYFVNRSIQVNILVNEFEGGRGLTMPGCDEITAKSEVYCKGISAVSTDCCIICRMEKDRFDEESAFLLNEE